jgi:hypothetical protein
MTACSGYRDELPFRTVPRIRRGRPERGMGPPDPLPYADPMPADVAPYARPDRRLLVGTGLATAIAFAVAVWARVTADRIIGPTGTVGYVAQFGSLHDDPIVTLNRLATVGVCAIGTGVLLFGATLVIAVLRHRGARLPLGFGIGAVVLVVAAVLSGIAAGRSTAFDVAATFATLRTALAGLAVATLPSIVVGAVRARAAHTRRFAGR